MARDRHAEAVNRRHWDEVAPVHLGAYRIDPLLAGGHLLDPVQVRELGDLRGKDILHLQCHIGTDTLSLVRLGGNVTGVDFSGESLKAARELARRTGLEARFVESSVYDLPGVLFERFDRVYTSIGVLCWLSDLDLWATVAAGFLKPEGVFYLMDSHPILQIFDDEAPGLSIRYPYFSEGEPVEWPGGYPDYADEGYQTRSPTREFTWPMGKILTALAGAGLRTEFLHEHGFLHWKALPCMEQGSDGYWRLPEPRNRLPLLFSLKAVKTSEV